MLRPGVLIVALTLLYGVMASSASAQTAFTYQGELKQNGTLANGAFDMEFTLWDAATAGNQIAGFETFDEVPVVDGRFTVELDFGASPFAGQPRWLQVKVNTITLAQRQLVTSAPYAIHTRGIFVNNTATFTGIGRSTPISSSEAFGVHSPAMTSYGGMYMSTQGTSGRPFYGYDAGGAMTSWHYLDGATGDWNLFHAGANRIIVKNDGRVGIGVNDTDVFGRLAVGTSLHSGLASLYVRNGVGTSISAYTDVPQHAAVKGQVDGTACSAILASADADSGVAYGVYSDCGTASGYDYFAAGLGVNYGSPSSIRWKRNITHVAQPLDMLARLRGVYFDWDHEHGGQHDIGFIGEEVAKVLPEVVAMDTDGVHVTGMDYSRLTPLLVEGVNALHNRVIEENSALRAENESLQSRLDAVEAALRDIRVLLKECGQ